MAANPQFEEEVMSQNVVTRSIPEELVLPQNYGGPNDGSDVGKGDPEADQRAIQLKLARSRVGTDRAERFVNDPNQTWSINGGRGPGHSLVPKLTDEQLEDHIARGLGTQGIFTVIEPKDLDLYRSFLSAPLQMPERPLVGATLLDMNSGNPINRFQEGRFSLKCLCPDGLESWLVVSTPVPFNLQCREGVIWGWPKYVADQISFSREENSARAEVLYFGEERYSLDFTAGPVADEAALRALGRVEGGNTVSWYWIQGGAVPVQAGEGTRIPERSRGATDTRLAGRAGQGPYQAFGPVGRTDPRRLRHGRLLLEVHRGWRRRFRHDQARDGGRRFRHQAGIERFDQSSRVRLIRTSKRSK